MADRLAALPPDVRCGLARLWALLPDARLVGGVVRDLLAGRAVADIDMATPEPPERVQAILAAAGVKVVATGLAHGTVTAVIDGRPYEITTLRRDERTDGRHAVVAWTADWQEDAARRDFTINAMSCDRDGVVHDYFGGRVDLAAGRVRFVGDASARIREDALRVLRFFRFHARYGRGVPDAAAMAAIGACRDGLARLSAERVWSELRRILAGPAVVATLALMDESGVLACLLPEGCDLPALERLIATGAPDDPVLRLAVLARAAPDMLAGRLRLSRAETAALAAVRSGAPPDPAMDEDGRRRLLADEPAQALVGRSWRLQAERLGARSAAWDALRADLLARARPVFPLAGRDLVEAGMTPGPQVGQVLAQVRGWWHAGGCRAGRRECLAYLERLVAAGPAA
ncbi:CCA tRNA nucleotidyltransferase [Gluconacetobacter takamatsuzukensis]|nr:CCA tRNA nucleotidyltransferase [Gluconacetobacter takamatsuzukensis]